MNRSVKRISLGVAAVVAACTLAIVATLIYQGRLKPSGDPQYVALGSSYAAGLGLGDQALGSPFACQRSVNGYPQQLARATGLSLVDMTCSGSTAEHVLNGGQFFQGPQLDAVTPSTQLVTLTSGGNDISYIGDLVAMGYHNRGGVIGKVVGLLMPAPHLLSERNIAKVEADIRSVIIRIRERAPSAQIVIATYVAVLPEQGTCPTLNLTEEQVALMRPVADQLANATRAAALAGGAKLVDMATIGKGHDACSREPWTNGLSPEHGAAFHPTQAGARATAMEIAKAAGYEIRP
jgi:lysophospholipase L1-like esterase